jgi:hypothetical protein
MTPPGIEPQPFLVYCKTIYNTKYISKELFDLVYKKDCTNLVYF